MAWDRKRDVRKLTGRPWRRLRDQILQRDNYLCTCKDCKKRKVPKPADEVDHVVPLAKGGTDDPSNLASMNIHCHALKTLIDSGQKPKVEIGADGWPV